MIDAAKDMEKASDSSPTRGESLSSTSTLQQSSDSDLASPGTRPPCFRSTIAECGFVAITTLTVAQSTIVSGAIRVQTDAMSVDLGMNSAEVTWVVAGQILMSGTFLLFFGRTADMFGRKRQLLIGMALFSVFLLASGFARDPILINVFLGLVGAASAACVPAAVGKLGIVYDQPSPRKNRAFSCFGAGAPIGIVIGTFVSGIATLVADWRASLWVLTVIYAALTVLAWFIVPDDSDQTIQKFNMETFKKFDWTGTLLSLAGISMFTSALTQAGVVADGWKTPYVLALFLVGAVLIITFSLWELQCSNPLIPAEPWRDRNFTLLLLVLCLGYYSFNCNTFWLTLVWQRIYKDSPLMVAVKFLPASVGGIIMCIVAALIIHRVSNRLISAIAAVSIAAASALISATGTGISFWALTFPGLVLSVVGQDLQFCVANLYVVSFLPKEQQSVAGGLIQTMSRLASSVGLGMQTSIYAAAGGANSGDASMLYRPYQVTFWVSLGGAVLALFFVPFIRLGTQGNHEPVDEEQVQSLEKQQE